MESSSWENDNSSSSSEPEDRERTDAIDCALEALKDAENLVYLDKLGHGTYGDVFLMHNPISNKQIAAKVVISKKVIPNEEALWQKLDHENVLIVETLLELSDHTIIFLTPLKFKALHSIIFEERFQTECRMNFKIMKKWLKDTLTGIDYLHACGYCHLDLKLDNVLVGYDGRACVCDFSFINFHRQPISVNRIGLPEIYRPPEVFRREDREELSGTAIDMWAYGMLVLEAFTNSYVLNNINTCKSWRNQIKPVLRKILDHEIFNSMVEKSFTSYRFTEIELDTILEFIDLFLKAKSKFRMLPKEALKHVFFKDVKNFAVDMSLIFPRTEFNTTYIIEHSDGKRVEIAMNYSDLGMKFQPMKRSTENSCRRREKNNFKITKTAAIMKAKIRIQIKNPKKYKLGFQTIKYDSTFSQFNLVEFRDQKLKTKESESEVYESCRISEITCSFPEYEEQPELKNENQEHDSSTCANELRSDNQSEKFLEGTPLHEGSVSSLQSFPSNEPTLKNSKLSLQNPVTTQEILKMPNEEVIEQNSENDNEPTTLCSWLAGKWDALRGAMCPICFCSG